MGTTLLNNWRFKITTNYYSGFKTQSQSCQHRSCTEKYNADFLINVLIPGFEAKICATRPILKTSNTKLHWDNARPHCAKKTKEKLAEKNIILLPHPAYSPDVAPSDFFLFGYLKDRLQGSQFETSHQLLEAITDIISSIPKETLNSVFEEWMDRLQFVVDNGGEFYCPWSFHLELSPH